MCFQVVPLNELRVRLDAHDAEAGSAWRRVPELAALPSGATTVADVAGASVLVCRLGSELLAYHNACVRCGFSLRGADLWARPGVPRGEFVLQCPGCDARYDVCRGGTLLGDGLSHLTPVPVMTERGVPSVMVGLSAGTTPGQTVYVGSRSARSSTRAAGAESRHASKVSSASSSRSMPSR